MLVNDTLRLTQLDGEDYEAVLRLSRAVYGSDHAYAEDWRFSPAANPNEPRFQVSAPSGLAAFGGLRAQPWMLQVRKRGLQLMVDPAFRRQGLGSELLERLLAAARGMEVRSLSATVLASQAQSLRFLTRRGFVEQERHWTLVWRGSRPGRPARALPEGVRVSSLAALQRRHADWSERYHRLWVHVAADQPNYDPTTAPPLAAFTRWLEQPQHCLEGTFVALDGEEYVGMSMVQTRSTEPGCLLQNITGVLPDYRRRGIATALKQQVLEYAGRVGAGRIVTENDAGNRAMLALNEKLGFERAAGKVRLERSLG